MSEPTSPQAEVQLDFRNGTEAARQARHAVRTLLGSLGSADADLMADTELVVSELVTNVVRHTDDGGIVRLRRTPAGVRVEVSDSDDRAPVFGGDADEATGGRGLRVVDHIASAWGVESGSSVGKTVWAELSPKQA
jgi:anti-sigma regulatory factor (Ser/Thr protein kinase)